MGWGGSGAQGPQVFACAAAGLSATHAPPSRDRKRRIKQSFRVGKRGEWGGWCWGGGGGGRSCRPLPRFSPPVLKPEGGRQAPFVPSGRGHGGAALGAIPRGKTPGEGSSQHPRPPPSPPAQRGQPGCALLPGPDTSGRGGGGGGSPPAVAHPPPPPPLSRKVIFGSAGQGRPPPRAPRRAAHSPAARSGRSVAHPSPAGAERRQRGRAAPAGVDAGRGRGGRPGPAPRVRLVAAAAAVPSPPLPSLPAAPRGRRGLEAARPEPRLRVVCRHVNMQINRGGSRLPAQSGGGGRGSAARAALQREGRAQGSPGFFSATRCIEGRNGLSTSASQGALPS